MADIKTEQDMFDFLSNNLRVRSRVEINDGNPRDKSVKVSIELILVHPDTKEDVVISEDNSEDWF